jgi:hypothetical protein
MSTKPAKHADKQLDEQLDKELDKSLAESFPASDPVSLTRSPKHRHTSERPAARADRKTPLVSASAEGQPGKSK